jgi:hypothetical protein
MNNQHQWSLKKKSNPGGRFGFTSLTALPIQPIHHKNGPNGLHLQCCTASSSKTAPRIFSFPMAMGADYSIELISIETYAPKFI